MIWLPFTDAIKIVLLYKIGQQIQAQSIETGSLQQAYDYDEPTANAILAFRWYYENHQLLTSSLSVY